VLLAIEEELVQGLGLAYRVVNVAAGDLGAPAAKKYDIEAFIPGEGRYREITSCSNTTDYQARRLGVPGTGVRYRDGSGALRHPHTLNGTAMTARWLIALLESNQQSDGSVVLPEVLVSLGAPKLLEAAAGR
jgi:seryl-tRNA synthetase